jgi:hypothetical protein
MVEAKKFWKSYKHYYRQNYRPEIPVSPKAGPNGITAKISRSQLVSSRTVPVTLPKMSWEK